MREGRAGRGARPRFSTCIDRSVPAQFLKKEIWLLDLKQDAHLRNETVWRFPGEPPSKRACIGKALRDCKSRQVIRVRWGSSRVRP